MGGLALDTSNEKDYMEIDLAEVVCILLANLRNILVVTLCCFIVAAGWLFVRRTASVYSSEACLQVKSVQQVFSGNGSGEDGAKSLMVNASYPIGDGLSADERMKTCAELLKSKSVLRKVTEALGETGTVVAEPIKSTRLLKVKFMAGNPEAAQKGNELLIREFQAFMADRDQFETRYITGDNLADTNMRGDLPAVEAVVVGHNEVEIVDEPTLPTAPVATNEKRTLAIGALLGLLIGSGYAIMHVLMNRKITTRKDVEDYLGLPVLAVVPEATSLAKAMARRNSESFLQKIGGFLWKEQN